MGALTFLPVNDWRNDGWQLVGAGINALYQALNNDNDSLYIKCPASKAGAAVTFPVDTTSVPDGAVITSVTVKLRCSTGTGTAPSGTAPSVTVSIAATDDTSRYTTRTIYPNGTPTTFEIATYQRDALGFAWDIFRLNSLFCRVFTYVGIFDLIRCYKFFCEIKYRVRPTITVDGPSGTVLTPSPTISWTYTQTDGDPQASAEYRLFTADQVSAVSFNPETAPPVFQATVTGDISSVILPTSLNANNYWVYVRAISTFKAKSVWVGRQFAVSGPSPGTPGVEDPTGALPPGMGVISVVPDTYQGAAALSLRDTSNMLSPQAADAENAFDGTAYLTTNAAIVRDTTTAFPGGTSSWKLTASAGGDMTLLSDWTEILGGGTITARAQFKTAATARSTRVRLLFYDAAYNALGGTLTGSSVSDATGTWTEAVVTGAIPSAAVYCRAAFDVLSAGASEIHNVDRLGIMYGTNTPWSDGGHMSRNLLSSKLSTAEGNAVGSEAWIGGAGSTVTTQAPTGTGASGSLCNKMTYAGVSPSIAFRGVGTTFNSVTSGTDFTINKPAGAVTGDLMIAYVTSSEYSTCTPPVGWTLVSTSRVDDGTLDTALFVLKRTCQAGDGTSWTGTVSVASARRACASVAYSGAADASVQFVAENQTATGNPTPLYLTTPTINNTDPNAWRICAFAVSDDATGGTMTANRQPPSTVLPISVVGTGTSWYTYSGNTSYVINKPSGVVTGDLMIAQVSISSNITIVPPTGWTLVRLTGNANGAFAQAIMYRYATSSEPSSWGGSLGASANVIVTGSVAYRNTHATVPFIAENAAAVGSGTSVATPTVQNTNSSAWRVTAFTAESTSTSFRWTSNDTVQRHRSSAYTGGGLFGGTVNAVEHAFYDSNSTIGTGPHTRTGTYSGSSFYGGIGWIGILNPLAAPPAAVADETPRTVAAAGSSSPWLTVRAFDSNGVAATGTQSITGIWSPSSGSDWNSMAGWVGLIKPAAQVTAGYVSAVTNTPVDVALVDTDAIPESDFVSVTAQFLGSAAGTPYLTVNFYRANALLNSLVEEGNSFGTSTWVKSAATFPIPEGTTRMTVGVSVSDRVIGDIVYWDRVSLAYGTDQTYRPGTSRDTHPIWSKPHIQYADDDGTGYTEWKDLPGLVANPPSYQPISGDAYYVDHTPIPLTNRKYRARTMSHGLAGDQFVSDWGPDSSEFIFEAENFWLKDIKNPDNNIQLKVKWDTLSVNTANTATVFQPLGEDLPVVLTEGYKGQTFSLALTPVNHEDWVKLRFLLRSGRTLFMQSDIDHAWWVQPIGDLQSAVLATSKRRSNPLREITVNFVEVEPAV